MNENAFFVGNSLDHLNLSESRLHILMNEAPFAAALFTGSEFIIEMANKIALSVWGKNESVIGKPLVEALPEIRNQPLFQRLKEVYSTGKVYQGHEDNLYVEMGGMLRNVVLNFTYKPVYDDERNITSVLAFGINVTEHVEGRKRIDESEERTRLAVEVAGIGTFDFNYVTDTFISSPRLNKIYGFDGPRPQADYVSAIHPDDLIIRKTAFRSALRTGELSYEARIVRPDTSIRWVRFKGKIFFDAEKIPTRLLGTVLDVTEQTLAIKRLEESEQRFRTLITETPEVASGLYIGKELRIQYVNDVMIRFWGKDISVIGKTFREALPELEGQTFFEQLDKVFSTGETFTGKEVKALLMQHGKLQASYFNYTFKALRNSNGEIYGIHHMAVDVTEQVLSKQKYIKSERKFRHLLMQAPFGICVLKGKDFFVEFANDTFLKLVGRRREEYAGKPVWIGMPELESQIYNKLMREVMRTGTAFHGREYELNIIRNGRPETVFVDFTYDSILDEEGKPDGIIVLAVDVTDKVLGRREIEKSRDRFYSILESLPQIAWTANTTGEIDYITQQWYEYTGQPEGSGLGARWIEAFPPEDRDALLNKFHRSVTGNTLFEEESKIRKHNGEYRWHLIRGVPIRDDSGKIMLWVGTSTDIHDQKLFSEELERKISERTRELERSNSELEQFAYVSSHDLQEPLRKISVFTDMLRKNLHEFPAGTGQYLDKISSAAFRMSNLIKDVLEFSRLSKNEKQFQRINLNEALKNVIVDFELAMDQKKAKVETGNLGIIEVIPLQIHQLFHNLLSNSLKFAAPDRHPCIRVQMKFLTPEETAAFGEINTSRQYVCIEWEDNGIGFPQEYANQIFVIFQRLNNRQSYAGTGIGLAICKKIVTNHCGEILVRSEVNKGTKFCIILPESQQ